MRGKILVILMFFLIVWVMGVIAVYDNIIKNTNYLSRNFSQAEECYITTIKSLYYNNKDELILKIEVNGQEEEVLSTEPDWLKVVEMTLRINGGFMYCDDGLESGLYSLHDYTEI